MAKSVPCDLCKRSTTESESICLRCKLALARHELWRIQQEFLSGRLDVQSEGMKSGLRIAHYETLDAYLASVCPKPVKQELTQGSTVRIPMPKWDEHYGYEDPPRFGSSPVFPVQTESKI